MTSTRRWIAFAAVLTVFLIAGCGDNGDDRGDRETWPNEPCEGGGEAGVILNNIETMANGAKNQDLIGAELHSSIVSGVNACRNDGSTETCCRQIMEAKAEAQKNTLAGFQACAERLDHGHGEDD